LHASTTSHLSISILFRIRDLSRRLQSSAILPYQRTSSDNLDCVLVYHSGSCRRPRWLPWGSSVVGLCRVIVSGLFSRLPWISGVVVWATVQVRGGRSDGLTPACVFLVCLFVCTCLKGGNICGVGEMGVTKERIHGNFLGGKIP
jgi:hypothetical protein